MFEKIKAKPLKSAAIGVVLVAFILLTGWLGYRFYQQTRQVYTIGVFYNSVNLLPEDLAVIKFLVGERVAEINGQGGIAGRPVQVKYLDDEGSREVAYQRVKETLPDENLIAYLGSWGSSRVQAVAGLVGESRVPYIGGYSVTEIAAPYANLYSYELGVNQVAFVVHKLLQAKASKVALIGNTGDIYSEALFEAVKQLARQEPDYAVSLEKWYPNGHDLSETELGQIADSLKSQADFLLLSTNPAHTNALLAAFGEQNIDLPVFTAFSDIPEINPAIAGYRQLELYDVSVFGIPSALNMRCQELEARYRKQLPESSRLLFQLGLGGLHADAIGLLKQAWQLKEEEEGLPVREKINQGLAEYIAGKRIFKGWFSDWYFTPERALVNEVLLGWKPPNLLTPVLAPLQYLRADSGLQQAPVFYTSIDLVELDQVSDQQGIFNASFFLEINAAGPFNLNQLDFVNAVRNEVDHLPLLTVKPVLLAASPGSDGLYQHLYRISGQFYFTPDLKNYPFDQQRFSITLQTNSALQPFLIQPPGPQQSDVDFSAPGWKFKNHFVGFDQDVIYTANPVLRQQRHVPYYKFSFSYVLKRARVDFMLKVLVPLLMLLVVTYFSVYIPIREFVSVTAIQVTALLSAIALYFSAYKPAMAFATISDKIFIFTYVMITTLIGATVLQYWLYRRREKKRQLSGVVSVYERVLFPVIVIGFTLFLII